MRVMPAAVESVMGLKVMTLLGGRGTRYLILLYDRATTELRAVLDADEVTRRRTAATTAVAGEMLVTEAPTEIGLLGTGFEAEAHLQTFAHLWPLERVLVFSRNPERRKAFAARFSDYLDIDIRPMDSSAAAVGRVPVSILATKAATPVVDGTVFPREAVVLSIGSTRPDLRELDDATLARTGTLLVDDATQVERECGDVMSAMAAGALDHSRIVSLAQAAQNPSLLSRGTERDLLSFKSVGTAIQDLTLARALVDAAAARGLGRDLGELTRLKPFNLSPTDRVDVL
jgi:ornithine cyclodeaminase/alanine dehydrogenase